MIIYKRLTSFQFYFNMALGISENSVNTLLKFSTDRQIWYRNSIEIVIN